MNARNKRRESNWRATWRACENNPNKGSSSRSCPVHFDAYICQTCTVCHSARQSARGQTRCGSEVFMRHLMRKVHCQGPRLVTKFVGIQAVLPVSGRSCHGTSSKLLRNLRFGSGHLTSSQRWPVIQSVQQDLRLPGSPQACHATSNEGLLSDDQSDSEVGSGHLQKLFIHFKVPTILHLDLI